MDGNKLNVSEEDSEMKRQRGDVMHDRTVLHLAEELCRPKEQRD